MDLSSPASTTNSPLVPVFGDNVQDLREGGALNVNPSAIITVNSIADTVDDPSLGVTTLRDAINQANADAGEDLIVFDRSLFSNAQTITLSGTELDITHNLDIIAPRDPLTGGDLVTVSGNKVSRVFEIETGATVSIDGLIVADGSVTNDNGGGIKNSGTLTLDNSIVRNNSANPVISTIARVFGGGIYNSGTVLLSNSTISGNSANSISLSNNLPGSGGGIFNSGGTVTVSNSNISGNSVGSNLFSSGNGGGISNSNGTVIVNNSTLSSNSAGYGGGISNGGNLTVSNSTISGNLASYSGYTDGAHGTGYSYGGGIFNGGNLTVSNSTISGNSANGFFLSYGGGIHNSKSGNLTVSNSTVSGNSANSGVFPDYGGFANYGGGISNDGNLTVSNSTISGNSVNSNKTINIGGGIYNTGTLTLLFSTLTLNFATNGGGVFNSSIDNNRPPGTVNVRNTIIAANLLSTKNQNSINPDVSGIFSSNGYNLIGDGTGSTGFDATGDIVGTTDNPIDPLLAPLAFNGGSTQTVALLPDSPAIDAADPTVLDTDPTTDQRGLPRVSNGRADIGAFEVQV